MLSGQLISSLFETTLLLLLGRELLELWRYRPSRILQRLSFALLTAALLSLLISPWLDPLFLPVLPQTIILDPITLSPRSGQQAVSPLISLLMKGYLVGVCILLSYWLISLFKLLYSHYHATSVTSARWHSHLHELTQRRIRLRCHSHITGPMTWGSVWPVIALPQKALNWSDAHIRWALQHEISHIENHDWLTQQLGRLSCLFFWPIPVVWQLYRSMCQEAEVAADQRALQAGAAPAEYAAWLLCQARGARSTAGVALAPTSSLEYRLRNILNPRQGESDKPKPTFLMWVLLALVISLPLATIQFTTLQITHTPQFGDAAWRHSRTVEIAEPGAALLKKLAAPLEEKTIERPTAPPKVDRAPRYPPATAPP
ncbi:M56 family metallopeptidase [Zhongshania sp. BJYM1]|uniref:M56 family metallopeptidase n=1 Tax=Zhongshania aquatica TaxID=2965069 RepID=UPI0022B564ED|nr:M56 family metallopeptidase [Marortus sp. BJYM1]